MNDNGKLKSLNLYGLPNASVGNGLLGKVNVTWIPDSACVSEIPGQPCTWQYFDRREDERFYYIKDHLGNIRITIDRDGEVVSAQDYFAYGEVLRSYNSGDANARFKFTEKERDTESGYDYFGARYYDSEAGIFRSVDPLAFKSPGLSPYSYCFNNPLIYIDPDGKFPWLAALRAKEIITGGLVLTGAVLSAVGLEETGRSINAAANWVSSTIPGIDFDPVTPTPFPIIQGEGINQTTIAPSDVTKVGGNIETLIDQGITPPTNLNATGKGTAKNPDGTTKNSLEQLKQIEKAQTKVRQGRLNKRIDSIEKSKQKVKSDLKNIKNLKDSEEFDK